MADIVINAASVTPGANAVIDRKGFAGEAIVAGEGVYRDPATKKWLKADADSATAAARHAEGFALNGAALDQPLAVHKQGDLNVGAVLTPGVAYYLSGAVAGKICPVADVGAGEYICLMGLAKSASVLAVNIQFPGVAN